MSTLLLSNEDVGKLIDPDEIYRAVEAGYASFSRGRVVHAPIVDLSDCSAGASSSRFPGRTGIT